MSDITVTKIPFISGGVANPDTKQLPVSWIMNREPLNGASSNIGSDGQLNRVGVQLQQNIETLESNQDILVTGINGATADIDAIKDALGTSADTTVAGRLATAEGNITTLQTSVQTNETGIATNGSDIAAIKTDVGTQSAEDSFYRTVRGDLLWIKQQIGNYDGYDINGQTADNTGSSQMKGKITSLLSSVSSQDTRLTSLEDINEAYSISDISNSVQAIRNELGSSSDAPTNGLYGSIDAMNTSITDNSSDIQGLKTAIDFSNDTSISDRVTTLEGKSSSFDTDLNDSTTGLIPRVKALETEVGDPGTQGSLVSRLTNIETETASLVSAVGSDDSSGLLKRVGYIETKLGAISDEDTPPADSILGQLSTLTTSVSNNTSNLQNLEVVVGNQSSGLVSDVAGLKSSSISDVEDSKMYVRTKGAWNQLSSSVAYMIYSGSLATTSTATAVDLSNATGKILNRATSSSSGITITDAGIYEIDIDLVINKTQASSTYVISALNGSTVIESATTGVVTNTGTQTIKLNTVTTLKASDVISLTLTSSTGQTTIVDYLRIKIKPLV